jgi:phosphoenolpyruvate carboxykinase (ATP)
MKKQFMSTYGKKADNASLKVIGLDNLGSTFWNLTPSELVEDIVVLGQGVVTDSGAIAIETGEFTGRSPQDRFIVCDEKTEKAVWWGDINKKIESDHFKSLFNRMTAYFTI